MATFLTAYMIVWVVLAAYVVRLGARQRLLESWLAVQEAEKLGLAAASRDESPWYAGV